MLGIIIALLEATSVALILPFLELASNTEEALKNPYLSSIYQFFEFGTESQLVVAAAWITLLTVACAKLLTIVSIWFQQSIAWSIAHNVSLRLVINYTELPYEFFLKKEPSDLIRSAIDDINKLIEGVILAGCNLISQLLVIMLILLLVLFVNPFVGAIAFMAISSIYILIILSRKSLLISLGKESLQVTSDRYRTFVDIVNGIKAIKSTGSKVFFVERFEKPSHRHSKIRPLVQITYSIPRNLVETIAFGTVLFIVLWLANSEDGFVDAIPALTLFTLAGYRLIPAMHSAYTSLAQILHSYPAISTIYNDTQIKGDLPEHNSDLIKFDDSITLRSLCFSYPGADTPTIDDVSFNISKGMKVALVGPSGSGKTTLVDLIMGLLEPCSGSIQVDDKALDLNHLDSWRQKIGYVPQDVFLYNDSVASNIAFGNEKIDYTAVVKAAQLAQISDFIETQLPNQYESQIGDAGSRLSGGQRQRIGLARALYRQPEVLILDEATSALDNVTEGNVLKAIHDELPNTTIITIAHRISTVIRCDKLFVIDRGKLESEGTYKQLIETCDLFKDLAIFD